MSLLKKKIEGSTIIEVIMALLIGMLVLAMAMAIVVKTGKNYNATHRTRAMFVIKDRLYYFQNNPMIHSDTIPVNGFLLYENLSEINGRKGVLNAYFKAMTTEGRRLIEKQHVINMKPEHEETE
ncbi:hypothetical protein DF185_03965 [Marinifilum breve]|uniref:Type II secretion system protein n=1 Tax=Marinifilum breve TaxID=2184082 RepID=A0A2V3ZZV2_9BACT|nr:hypothetical protein [Marinifilum breve]PXY01813.1 hypothetical protein DF185_03965 [Marinifilum breve]